jgi:hypothetical protein
MVLNSDVPDSDENLKGAWYAEQCKKQVVLRS